MKDNDGARLTVVRNTAISICEQACYDCLHPNGRWPACNCRECGHYALREQLDTLPRARVLKGVVRQFHDKRAGYLKYIGVIRIRELPKPGTPVQVVIPGEVDDG